MDRNDAIIVNNVNGYDSSWTSKYNLSSKLSSEVVTKVQDSDMVGIIREYDKDAVIIVGTGTWSQDVDQVIGNKLSDKNVMYTLHFYAATHGDWLIDRAQKALDAKVPIFITECSICSADGNGSINKTMGNKWMKFIRKNKIPFICWNLSNKDEASALIKESCTKKSGWTTKQLSTTGKWFKSKMIKY